MAEYIVMPKLGFDMREGVLVGWLKDVGEEVSKGDVVAEIESDKATLELESQVSGVMLKHLAAADDVVPVGANLAIVGAEGEDISGLDSGGSAEGGEDEAPEAKGEASADASAKDAAASSAAASESASSGDQSEYPGGVKATPVARRIAADKNIDLSQVSGSGPGGRIRKADVEAFAEQGPAKAAAAPAAALQPSVTVKDTDEVVPLTKLRQAIARRMVESKRIVPHFYVTSEMDMAPLFALRKQVNEMLTAETKVSVNDMIVKAAAVALRDFPNLNASFNGDTLVRHTEINVGSAVAVEGGLLTVVQKNTDSSSLSKIAADHKAMIGRARAGRVHPDDVQGGTFTVSNLGAFDVENFIAIVNPPDAVILAVGSARKVPVVVDGELTVGMRMKVTASADHRVTDGAEVAQYLQALKAVIEEPMRLMI
ncbi:MAG TPA: dihydrolipoamide acetyltransferase family protein [Anaerolineae bacterium]|nr:dihydrolipoamide acetyltransferase family protein [Anaerolineae bacterium]